MVIRISRANCPSRSSVQQVVLPRLLISSLMVIAALGVPAKTAAPPQFAAEHGRLRVDGLVFRDEAGAIWSWRGANCFLCFARVLRGENVAPQLNWARAHGVNVLRVFGQVDWPSEPDYKRPDTRPDFAAKLNGFFAAAAASGLRVEYTVLTYPHEMADMKAELQRVYDIAAAHWNVFVEVANEPDAQSIDAATAIAGVNRRGVLSALGYYDPRPGPRGGAATLQMLDYVTVHTGRHADWIRRAKFGRDLRDGYAKTDELPAFAGAKRPVVGDEPMGAAEKAEPGRRSATVEDFAAHFAICAMFSAGCTYHFQAGLEGRAPNTSEPIQQAIAKRIYDVWRRIPGEVQTCQYSRGGLQDLPVIWEESHSLRTYAAICGGIAYIVVAQPKAGYLVQPKPGWRVTGRYGVLTMLSR